MTLFIKTDYENARHLKELNSRVNKSLKNTFQIANLLTSISLIQIFIRLVF